MCPKVNRSMRKISVFFHYIWFFFYIICYFFTLRIIFYFTHLIWCLVSGSFYYCFIKLYKLNVVVYNQFGKSVASDFLFLRDIALKERDWKNNYIPKANDRLLYSEKLSLLYLSTNQSGGGIHLNKSFFWEHISHEKKINKKVL